MFDSEMAYIRTIEIARRAGSDAQLGGGRRLSTALLDARVGLLRRVLRCTRDHLYGDVETHSLGKCYHPTPADRRYTGYEHKAYLRICKDGRLFTVGNCGADDGYDGPRRECKIEITVIKVYELWGLRMTLGGIAEVLSGLGAKVLASEVRAISGVIQ